VGLKLKKKVEQEVEGSSRVVDTADDELLPVGPLPSLAVIRLLSNPLLSAISLITPPQVTPLSSLTSRTTHRTHPHNRTHARARARAHAHAHVATDQFYVCLINYVLVGMLPYAVSGYKDSGTWLMWTNIAATVTSSLGRFLCTWFRYYSLTWVSLAQVLIRACACACAVVRVRMRVRVRVGFSPVLWAGPDTAVGLLDGDLAPR